MPWLPQIQGRPTPTLYESGGFSIPEVQFLAVSDAALLSLEYFNTVVPRDTPDESVISNAFLQSLTYFNTLVSRDTPDEEATQAAKLQTLTYFLALVTATNSNPDQGIQNAVLQSLTYFLAIVSREPADQLGTQETALQSLEYTL